MVGGWLQDPTQATVKQTADWNVHSKMSAHRGRSSALGVTSRVSSDDLVHLS